MKTSLFLPLLHYLEIFLCGFSVLSFQQTRISYSGDSSFIKVESRELFPIQPLQGAGWVLFLTWHLLCVLHSVKVVSGLWICEWASAAELIHVARSVLLFLGTMPPFLLILSPESSGSHVSIWSQTPTSHSCQIAFSVPVGSRFLLPGTLKLSTVFVHVSDHEIMHLVVHCHDNWNVWTSRFYCQACNSIINALQILAKEKQRTKTCWTGGIDLCSSETSCLLTTPKYCRGIFEGEWKNSLKWVYP